MAEPVQKPIGEPQRRIALISVPWSDVSDPGTYVEVRSGDLYRLCGIPRRR
jgi:hypothetical protein